MKNNLKKSLSILLVLSFVFCVMSINVYTKADSTEMSIINNYDETNAVYKKMAYTNSSGQAVDKYYTTRTVDDNSITYFSYYDATIESSPNQTNAVLFGDNQRNEIGGNGDSWPNQVRIYDSNASDLAVFTPTANTTYSLSLEYYIGTNNFSVNNGDLLIKIARLTGSGVDVVSVQEYYATVATIDNSTEKGTWITASVTFTTANEVTPLVLTLQTASTNTWWSYGEIWVDNISLTWTGAAAEEEEKETVPAVYPAEMIVDEDFSDVAIGKIPENWVKDIPYTFLWAGNTATGLSGDSISVISNNGKNYLQNKSGNGGHILTLPQINVDNYIYTVEFEYVNKSGTIGIATDVFVGSSANIFQVSSDNIATIYTRVQNSTNYGGQDSDKQSFDGITLNTQNTLSCYKLNDKYSYYLNGTLIGERSISATNGVLGIYSYGTNVLISSVTIQEMASVNEVEEKFYSAKTYIDTDFSEYSSLPDGFVKQESSNGVFWETGKGTAEIKTVDGVKGLYMTANGGTSAVTLPNVYETNYVLTAQIKILSETGSYGLLTNMETDTAPTKATNLLAYLDGTFYMYNREGWNQLDRIADIKITDVLDSVPTKGDTVTLKAFNYDGITLFFINDCFVTSIEQRNPETESALCGIYACGSEILVTNLKLEQVKKYNKTDAFVIDGAAVKVAGSNAIKFVLSMDKQNELYTSLGVNEVKYGAFISIASKLDGNEMNINTPNTINIPFDSYTESENDIKFETKFNIANTQQALDTSYAVRGYVEITDTKGDKEYYYSTQKYFCPSEIATKVKANCEADDVVLTNLNSMYSLSKRYSMNTVKFSLFSDLHYKEGMYMSSVDDVQAILDRANRENADFVMQTGDFCNDFIGSPEITNAYLKNNYNLPVYGVYGNHELESYDNSMQVVTPLLTNKSNGVVWGTADGKIGDGSVGYYYFDVNGYRMVCVDTNYSYNTSTGEWEHNRTCSFGAPSGNKYENSLGPVQLKWLEKVLVDAAQNCIPCIVFGHESFSNKWETSPDTNAVRAIYNKVNEMHKGTVLMSINGHLHTDHVEVMDGILFLDVNTVRNGFWQGDTELHYLPTQTFVKKTYDANGNETGSVTTALNDLTMGKQTWFFNDPLNAIVTISASGNISVDGMQSSWLYDVVPPTTREDKTPKISDYQVSLNQEVSLNSKKYLLNNEDVLSKLNMQGRYDTNENGIELDWSASAIEFTADCKGTVGAYLNTNISSSNTENVIYFALYVDGVRVGEKIAVKNGKTYIKFAENLTAGVHTFSLVRLNDVYCGSVDVTAIELDGQLKETTSDKKVIEFIGDSITAGVGNLGDSTVNGDLKSEPSYHDATKAYSYLTAEGLGLDYNIAARSGIALYYGYGHTEGEDDACQNFTKYYDYQNYFRDTNQVYSPKRSSDIVCINLGTNDFWSGKCPDNDAFAEKMVSFVSKVEEYNPNAKILLLTGGINSNNVTAVNKAYTMLGGESAGYYICNMSYGLQSGVGNHPNTSEHEIMANELIAFLRNNELV